MLGVLKLKLDVLKNFTPEAFKRKDLEFVKQWRKLAWKIFYALLVLTAGLLIMTLIAGLIFVKGIWKIFFLLAFAGTVYGLVGIISKKVFRKIEPLEVGLLVDKIAGRTEEVQKEGIALVLPTDNIIFESIKSQCIPVKDDYMTIDGSITLTCDFFYTVYTAKLGEHLVVKDQLITAVKGRVQGLLQIETGDRTTDETIAELGPIKDQLNTEIVGSPTEIKIGRLGLHRQKLADLKLKLDITDGILKRLGTAEKESAKRVRVDMEKTADELKEKIGKRINMSVTLVEDIILLYQEQFAVHAVEPEKINPIQIRIELSKLENPLVDTNLNLASLKGEEWLKNKQSQVNELKKICETWSKQQEQRNKEREVSGFEKDFIIEYKGVNLYNPELPPVAKNARDKKLEMKYTQEAIITEYQTTKQSMRILKDELPHVTEKDVLDYVKAMRGKRTETRLERTFEIPQLKDISTFLIDKLLKSRSEEKKK